jgi:hypothetical protein
MKVLHTYRKAASGQQKSCFSRKAIMKKKELSENGPGGLSPEDLYVKI